MIAIIAGEEAADTAAVQYAFAHAGFAPRHVSTPDRAEEVVRDQGCANCVLAIDASLLSAKAGEGPSWASFLADHPALGAVVTSHGRADEVMRKITGVANRVVLENPFDAAAVVAGVRRAVASPMTRVARSSEPTSHERAGGH